MRQIILWSSLNDSARDSFKIKAEAFIKIASSKLYETETAIYDCSVETDIV